MRAARFDNRKTKYHGVNFGMTDHVGTHDAGFMCRIQNAIREIGTAGNDIGLADCLNLCMEGDVLFCFPSFNAFGNDDAVLNYNGTHG